MRIPSCRRFSLRTLLTVVTVSVVLTALTVLLGDAMRVMMDVHDRHAEKQMKIFYLRDGTVDTEFERGKGLFSDEELEAIRVERDRLTEDSIPATIPSSTRTAP